MPKVTIYTQVHNAGAYLEPCISSVLNQTYQDFEYIIVDSASTDGSSEILDAFAAKDKRIRLIRLDKNRVGVRLQILRQHAKGEYHAVLDHDDWWEPNHLESLLNFAQANQLDIACTGTCMHAMATGGHGFRRLERPIIVEKEQFPDMFPWYYAFMRTNWGKLIRADLAAQVRIEDAVGKVFYGGDTVYCFQLLRHAKRIGIDSTILHHYRIHAASQSFQYNPRRFESDGYLLRDAESFLSSFGPISPQNRLFLDCVYSNALVDTSGVLANAAMSDAEKLHEYRVIAEHPATQSAYRQQHEDIRRSRETLLNRIFQAGGCTVANNRDLTAAVQALTPSCRNAVAENNVGLIVREADLSSALLQDNKNALAKKLLGLLAEKKYVKQYDIAGMLSRIVPDGSPLQLVTDAKFWGKYADICYFIFIGQNLAALDQMTEQLLSGKKLYNEELFLQIYLTLAAIEEQVPAFIFGKIRLAELYQQTGRLDDCRNVIAELDEMGAGEHEAVAALRENL